MATKSIDLNCDMGESYGRWTLGADEEIMPRITSANVACGFHGGDPHVMRKTVALALRHGVAIGSHPGLPDLMGFGRRVMDVTPQEVKDYLCYQTGARGGAGGQEGDGRQGEHARRRRDRYLGADHLLPRRHAGRVEDRAGGARRAR